MTGKQARSNIMNVGRYLNQEKEKLIMHANKVIAYQDIDGLRNRGEALPDSELAARAIVRFGRVAGARFCQRQGICLEDCLEALKILAAQQFAELADKNWLPE